MELVKMQFSMNGRHVRCQNVRMPNSLGHALLAVCGLNMSDMPYVRNPGVHRRQTQLKKKRKKEMVAWKINHGDSKFIGKNTGCTRDF